MFQNLIIVLPWLSNELSPISEERINVYVPVFKLTQNANTSLDDSINERQENS